jgi:PIN domain nuclease of toxin-antitoxin system
LNVLLDTYVLLWWDGGDKRLNAPARAVIQDQNNTV